MNLVLLIFLLLVPVSGFVAWAGDRIGHKIGKRRHSLLGLRPRHTATLMTVFAGMAIALFSFGLMYASVPTFRRVLTDGATLYATNRLLKRENKTLQGGVAAQQVAAARLNGEVEQARRGREAAVAAQKSALTAQKTAEVGLAGAKQQVQDAQSSLRTAQKNLQQARGGLAQTRSQLRDKQRRIAEAGKRVAAAQKRVVQARARARGAEQQVQIAVARRESVERAAEKVAGFAREQRRRADAQAALAQSAEREVERQQTRLGQLSAEVGALETRRTRLKNALDESLSNTFDLRQGRITYEVGEEIDRLSLPSGLDPAQAQRELARLIARAADKAQARGAKPSETGKRNIVLVSRRLAASAGAGTEGGAALITTASENGASPLNVSPANEDALIGAAADAIARAGDDVAVLVVAAANAVEGEPVPVELRTYRNRRVLRQNTVVGQITLDGSRPPAAVADALYAFLRRDVRRQLLDSGIIPPSPGAHDRLDGDESGESVVQIGGGQWLKLLDEVRQTGPDAQVVVRAASDLRAADPVTLRFEVAPLRLVTPGANVTPAANVPPAAAAATATAATVARP